MFDDTAGLCLTLARMSENQLVAIVGAFGVAIVAIVTSTIRSVLNTRAREESRREIAAYVAEGSISPDDAERILAAKMPKERGCGGC